MKILLPVDGSLYSAYAASFLKACAPFLSTTPEIEVFNVQRLSSGLLSDLWDTESYQNFCRAGAARAFAGVRRAFDSLRVPVHEKYATGPVIETILQEADSFGPDLIVMGTKGKTSFDRLVMGSVTTGVIAGAKCPLLLIRSPYLPKGRDLKVGLAVDGSEYGAQAARFLARSADRLGAQTKISLIHVSDDADDVFYYNLVNPDYFKAVETVPEKGGDFFEQFNAKRVAFEKEESDRAFATVLPVLEPTGLPLEEVTLSGDVGPILARYAEQMGLDLLVMGSRGLDNGEAATTGSITTRVLAEGRIPVLVVKS
ncbi:universal stress protein [Mesosutterella sp. OilRF-GAM-744-9]|uniref:Universal stress protein n=1 Tax=Mesosutterella porci TaxID=2915351 RepID=A0ABS9MNA1_9BURK|nr:universal stress protein [Mesosutterella sp. oilRF-744-WT-GAM-9]MCG5030099.1 universal stress protein [Mesosutterella sp. oilRF-744-WT-GAM-9]